MISEMHGMEIIWGLMSFILYRTVKKITYHAINNELAIWIMSMTPIFSTSVLVYSILVFATRFDTALSSVHIFIVVNHKIVKAKKAHNFV